MSMDFESDLHQARELSESGDNERARTLLLEVLEQDSTNQAAMLMLGGEYFCMGKLAEAEMVFLRLVTMEPGIGKFSIALFNTLWKQERQTEAVDEISRFLAAADKEAEMETIAEYVAITKKIAQMANE